MGTYFNAFPESYWQHWTSVRQVQLTVRTTGPATILVYRSNGSRSPPARGHPRGDGRVIDVVRPRAHAVQRRRLDLFDIVADEKPAVLEGAEWTTDQEPKRTGKASLGSHDVQQADYCVETLRALAASHGRSGVRGSHLP